MAKITFQDEQGQNLNRYKMTPVEGQTDTYDLEREANITQQGTPINAENMNRMAQDEDVAELAGPNRTTETVKGNADALTSHKNDNNNPHGVTAEQTGSIPISQKGTSGGVANYDDLAAHASNAGIHVTAAQKTAWTAKADKSTTVNGHALTGNVTVTAADVGAIPTSQKGTAGGVATLGDDGKVPAEQLSIPAPNYAGTLVVHVTSSDGGSVAGTRVRIRNEQLGSNYVQPLDALGNTTFSLLDNHTYYVVLLDYPSSYYGAAATVTITGGETQELDLVLKTEPDIVGWDLDQTSGSLTYTDGAADHIPMSITDGELDTGSWANSWLTKMRPCLLKNGVVQYYLKKTGNFLYDYSKQADGTAADITSGDDGDVMIEFPLVYYKFYQSTDVQGHSHVGCKYSQTAQDDTWCANAFLDRSGNVQNAMYMGAYDGAIFNSKLRSLSGTAPTVSMTIGAFRTAANANGSGYEQCENSKIQFVTSLLPMLFKSLDGQAAVGQGFAKSSNTAAISTGTMNDKPLFWGDQTGTAGVKFCGIENFWGNIFKWLDGVGYLSGKYGYRIYAPYNDSMSGYSNSDIAIPGSGYIDTMSAVNGYGLVPKTTASDEASSKFHDYFYGLSSSSPIVLRGGNWYDGAYVGSWCWSSYAASNANDVIGASLSYTPQ